MWVLTELRWWRPCGSVERSGNGFEFSRGRVVMLRFLKSRLIDLDPRKQQSMQKLHITQEGTTQTQTQTATHIISASPVCSGALDIKCFVRSLCDWCSTFHSSAHNSLFPRIRSETGSEDQPRWSLKPGSCLILPAAVMSQSADTPEHQAETLQQTAEQQVHMSSVNKYNRTSICVSLQYFYCEYYYCCSSVCSGVCSSGWFRQKLQLLPSHLLWGHSCVLSFITSQNQQQHDHTSDPRWRQKLQ